MPASWVKAAAAAALWSAGSVLADLEVFSDVRQFDKVVSDADGFASQRYRSSDIRGPVLQVNTWEKEQVDDAGYLFLGTVYGHMKAGPMILDASDFSLVYADQRYENTYTSDAVMVHDQRYMAFWEGYHTRGHANGFCLLYDEQYDLKYNVTAQGLHGALADMHEMKVTNDGTVIFSTYWNRDYDCSSVGGPKKALLQDSGFQEVDIETNKVVFDWHASDHFNLTDSVAKYSGAYGVTGNSGFDFFHINSVDKTPEGDYLVSSRHCSTLCLVDGKSGNLKWILGGKRNQFEDLSGGNATNFAWQHDARFYNSTHITMFDNHGEQTDSCKEKSCNTRGLHLEIDEQKMTVQVVHEYYHPEHVNSGAMGGFQHLDNGNVLLGWGYNPSIVEYKPDGTPVLDIQRGKIGSSLSDMFAYRVNKHDWKGVPRWPPSIAVDYPARSTVNGTVFVSWNGATEVKEWIVMASDDAMNMDGHENIIARSARSGFETIIHLPSDIARKYVAAAAIDADGKVLDSTFVIDMSTGMPFFVKSIITSIEALPPPPPAEEPIPDEPVIDASEPVVDTETEVSSDAGESAGEQPPAEGKPEEAAKPAESEVPEESKGSEDSEEESMTSKHFSGAAMMGASIFLFAAVFYGIIYYWRRKHSAGEVEDHEKGQYRRVEDDES